MKMNHFLHIITFVLCAFLLMACEAGIGDKCTTSNECPSGTICDTDSPDGYCLASGCESDQECPEDATCVEFSDGISYCLKRCKNNSDCRSRYECRKDLGTSPFCYVPADGIYGRDEQNKVDFVPPTDNSSAEQSPANDQENDEQNSPQS